MITFNNGKTSDAYPYFTGTVCTIYDMEPNTSGFSEGGMNFSDFTTLYRRGDGWYQLSNDGLVCQDEAEEVPSKEEIESSRKHCEVIIKLSNIEYAIKELKKKLSASDYIVIKMAEGVDVSQYDVEQIKRERQQLRDEINKLEEEHDKLCI